MKKFEDFDKVIITDEKHKPMAWNGDQLCYCENEFWQDEAFPVKIYTKATAKKYIAKTKQYRKSLNFNTNGERYILFPVATKSS